MTNPGRDQLIQQQREQIAELDRQLLLLINQRIELVAQLRGYKAVQGLDFYDPVQEARLIEALAEANAGPLSQAGLRDFFGALLELVKREANPNP